MACITLTRIALPQAFGAVPTRGWEVAYEGQRVATYAEEVDGWLHQIGSSRLDDSLRNHSSKWGMARKYPSLDALRDAYVLCAKAREERQVGEGPPWG